MREWLFLDGFENVRLLFSARRLENTKFLILLHTSHSMSFFA